MTDNFPRIHSLVTVGIKQHFDCDYLFHPLRTDFSGESGSGKSMVADMIQLVLVCTGAYQSATQGNSAREPKGMVIQPKGHQHGIGYVVLNIETYPGKYIVIGACLESAHNQVLPFIIQGGYDWEETLTPLAQPIRYRKLMSDEQIVPVQELAEKLSDVNLKSFTKKKYHQLLHRHGLLALDLANDKKKESYAGILQAFSRGSGFKTNSEWLKKFLFGNEDQQRFLQKFKDEVLAIYREFQDQERYQREIELINNKESLVVEVVGLHRTFRKLETTYLEALNGYWHNLLQQEKKTWKAAHEKAEAARLEADVIEDRQYLLEIEMLSELTQLLEQQQQKQKLPVIPADYEKTKQQYERLKQYKVWLQTHENNPQKVADWFTAERKKTEDKELLQRFENHLDKYEQRAAFEASDWLTDYPATLAQYDEDKLKTETRLSQLKALSTFSDISNSESLAGWAIQHLNFPVSREFESVLVHFQQLPGTEPESKVGERYLPFPENLFDNLKIKEKSEAGFWIDLDGVYEFISFVPNEERYLNEQSGEQIKELLDGLSNTVGEDLRKLQEEHQKNEILYQILKQFSATESAINLYTDREKIRSQEPDIELTRNEFEQYVANYKNRAQIETQYKEKHETYLQATKSIEEVERETRNRCSRIRKIEQYFNFDKANTQQVTSAIDQRSRNNNDDEGDGDIQSKKRETAERLFPKPLPLAALLHLKNDKTTEKGEIEKAEEKSEQRLAYAQEESDKAKDQFLTTFKKLWQHDEKRSSTTENPNEGDKSLFQQYDDAKRAFETQYEVARQSTDHPEQLEGYHIGYLANKLLPTVFHTTEIDDSRVEETIAKKLSKLTHDLQVIGGRKLEILKRIFSEVHDTYQEYLEKVTGINNYFKRKKHSITGGNRASLTATKAPGFPDHWMAPFRKQLDDYSEVTEGLFESLKTEVDIYNMMKKAFQAAGGSPNVTHEDLLNPKSYFDLHFDIKLKSGEANAGSNGQTYTANALLCLARLSLIEDPDAKGICIMPIDEAEQLGGNYDMLHELAREEKYQIVSMSIETAGEIEHGEQYVYIMNENSLDEIDSYVPPLGIFSDGEIQEDIDTYITKTLANE